MSSILASVGEQVGNNVLGEVEPAAKALLIAFAIVALLAVGGRRKLNEMLIVFAIVFIISLPILNNDGFVRFMNKLGESLFKGI